MENKDEKYEGLGNTWSSVLGKDLDVESLAKEVIDAQPSIVKSKGDFVGIISFNAPMKAVALLFINPDKKHTELWSLYPFLHISNPIAVEIQRVDEWKNKGEAVIWGSINGVSISFFDALYFLNKDKYEEGKTSRFHLGAIAHSFRKRTENLIIEPTEGPLKGEKLYTQKITAFKPAHEYGGEATYICPFTSFNGETQAFNTVFKIFPFHLMSADSDHAAFSLPMYVRADLVESDVAPGDSIEGAAWLQGYLVDSLDETTDESGEKK